MMNKLTRNNWKNSFLIAVLFFLTAACVDQQKPDKKVTKYYDVKEVLDNQIDLLSVKENTLYKSIWLDGKFEKRELNLSEEEWKKELQAFYDLNLNKSVFKDAYQIQKESLTSGEQITYRAYNPEKVQVEYLIVWLNGKKALTRLEALYHEDNNLYHSKKRMTANFKMVDNEYRLNDYVVEGMQKVVLKDSVTYRLEANVEYKE